MNDREVFEVVSVSEKFALLRSHHNGERHVVPRQLPCDDGGPPWFLRVGLHISGVLRGDMLTDIDFGYIDHERDEYEGGPSTDPPGWEPRNAPAKPAGSGEVQVQWHPEGEN